MNCSISKEGSVNVVFLDGDLDATTEAELTKILGNCSSDGVYQIILEMGAVGYVSSNGLRPLLVWLENTRGITGKRRLALCNLGPFVREVFSVTELDRKFPIYDSADVALDAFR